MINSLFIQRSVEKVYKTQLRPLYISMYSNIAALTPADKLDLEVVSCGNENNIVSENILGMYELEAPLLSVGDKFVLEDKDKLVVIKDVVRSSDGSIRYVVEDELVTTDYTEQTKLEAEEEVKQFHMSKVETQTLRDTIAKLEQKIDSLQSRPRFFKREICY